MLSVRLVPCARAFIVAAGTGIGLDFTWGQFDVQNANLSLLISDNVVIGNLANSSAAAGVQLNYGLTWFTNHVLTVRRNVIVSNVCFAAYSGTKITIPVACVALLRGSSDVCVCH